MGHKPKVKKKRKGSSLKEWSDIITTPKVGRLTSTRPNISNTSKTRLPKTQKQLFDKIYELISAEGHRNGWDNVVSAASASITTYLVSNNMVDMES